MRSSTLMGRIISVSGRIAWKIYGATKTSQSVERGEAWEHDDWWMGRIDESLNSTHIYSCWLCSGNTYRKGCKDEYEWEMSEVVKYEKFESR